jgi:hypothetical protein
LESLKLRDVAKSVSKVEPILLCLFSNYPSTLKQFSFLDGGLEDHFGLSGSFYGVDDAVIIINLKLNYLLPDY